MYPIGSTEAYDLWTREHDSLSETDRNAIHACVTNLAVKPLFSLVLLGSVPIDAPALDALFGQIYPNLELFAPQVLLVGCDDPRAIPLMGDTSDVVTMFNAALARASGDFVVAVPADAILPPHALFELADALADAPNARVLFSDEDCIDAAGTRTHPRFKVAWDPDLMLGCDAVGNLAALRLEQVRAVGGLRPPTAGTVDLGAMIYDLVLRLGQSAPFGTMVHVPAVLCHRSILPAAQSSATACRQVVRQHLAERGLDARVAPAPLIPEANRVYRPLPARLPLVSILVPTRDQADVLARCVEGVLSRTEYLHFELLILDNDSCAPETMALFSRLLEDRRVRVLHYPGPFNYSTLNNKAVAQAQGEVLVLLNNDTDVIAPDWLTELVSHAIRPEIGAVGAKLLYADETVQHCGITMGPGLTLTHQLRRSARTDPGPGGELALVRSISAVTGACLAVRATVYREVGGLDERNFPVAFNDVDFCLRLADFGYRQICTPFAELFHLESVTRGHADSLEKQAEGWRQARTFQAVWEPLLETDPYHNPNLLYLWESAEYAAPPRRRIGWRPAQAVPVTEPRRIYRSVERAESFSK